MMIISSLAFSLMSVLVRLAGEMPAMQKVVFRTGITGIVSFVLLYRTLWNKEHKFKYIKNSINSYRALVIRVVAGTVGITINFYCIDHLNLADANMIYKFSTVIVLLSYF